MEKESVIIYWQDSAKTDLATARDLVELKHYHWALFVYHLSIEKLLKVCLIKNNIRPPFTHDLERLAVLAKLTITDKVRKQLEEISHFNLDARYDNEKLAFYKKADINYTRQWAATCEEIITWLNKSL